MPELPEVETIRKGIEPYLLDQQIVKITIREKNLRWPIPLEIESLLNKATIEKIERRGKYLLISTSAGTLILHLGMSGHLRILPMDTPLKKHDHVDITLTNQIILRLNDPRRFGAVLFTEDDPLDHPLLAKLGPEPLTSSFSADYLSTLAKNRKVAVKSFIMNNHVVTGVGNIYATESLFCARLHPEKSVSKIHYKQYETLVTCIKTILQKAIKAGGTTLKDFFNSNGSRGLFKVHLNAYGRKELPCLRCKTILKETRLGQRSTVYCPRCQKK